MACSCVLHGSAFLQVSYIAPTMFSNGNLMDFHGSCTVNTSHILLSWFFNNFVYGIGESYVNYLLLFTALELFMQHFLAY